MKRRFSAALAIVVTATLALPVAAQTDFEQEIRLLFDEHVALCGPAMSDADSFRAALPNTFPAGTFGFTATEDNRLERTTISTREGRVSTQHTVYRSPTTIHENCVSYFSNIAWFDVDITPIAEAFVAVATERLGRENLVGGNIPVLRHDYHQTGSDVLVAEPNNYEFLMVGVLEGDGLYSITGLGQGYVSLITTREITQSDQ